MGFAVDDTTYRKDFLLAPGKGWGGVRPGGIKPTTIVIHTTNNAHPTAFATEANYLRRSLEVSTHYLIGKAGQIVAILPPPLEAWHAGEAVAGFTNAHSIGIELHVSVGETPLPLQREALTWLVRQLIADYHMVPASVETHRAIALPKGRKSDPEGWPDGAFYAWRNQLVVIPEPTPYRYAPRLPIYQASTLTGPLAGFLAPGEQVAIDARAPLPGYAPTAGHLSDGRGFVDISKLEGL